MLYIFMHITINIVHSESSRSRSQMDDYDKLHNLCIYIKQTHHGCFPKEGDSILSGFSLEHFLTKLQDNCEF